MPHKCHSRIRSSLHPVFTPIGFSQRRLSCDPPSHCPPLTLPVTSRRIFPTLPQPGPPESQRGRIGAPFFLSFYLKINLSIAHVSWLKIPILATWKYALFKYTQLDPVSTTPHAGPSNSVFRPNVSSSPETNFSPGSSTPKPSENQNYVIDISTVLRSACLQDFPSLSPPSSSTVHRRLF